MGIRGYSKGERQGCWAFSCSKRDWSLADAGLGHWYLYADWSLAVANATGAN